MTTSEVVEALDRIELRGSDLAYQRDRVLKQFKEVEHRIEQQDKQILLLGMTIKHLLKELK